MGKQIAENQELAEQVEKERLKAREELQQKRQVNVGRFCWHLHDLPRQAIPVLIDWKIQRCEIYCPLSSLTGTQSKQLGNREVASTLCDVASFCTWHAPCIV